ncbi:MAG: ABC transporter ATP-binding protein [Ruminococcaceae bacterium]|nr:ABC transporter ATP-binding protein [Oscillospiraceae bacterium]
MSVRINIKNARKQFGEVVVIPDLNLNIREGEFFTLLGPSGCGKTTLLRMIAGFNSIEGGQFYFNDTLINHMDPGKRNIGMVFQNYAIFPNMTVRKNVAYGLTNRKIPPAEVKKLTDEFLGLVHVDQYADRMPDRLSGGQQQRVALARALVIHPDVLLMDEPLSNLDAKLRVEMRTVIKNIQKSVGITTVYVTHDQEEAMAVSDRIAVMNGGVIQHVGTPKDIYQRPANLFVSTFIGRSNVLKGELMVKDEIPYIKLNSFEVPMLNIRPEYLRNQKITISVRPEELLMQKGEGDGIKATVDDSVFLGLNTHYFMHLEDGTEVESIQESTIDSIIPNGSVIRLMINTQKVNLFTENGSANILIGVQNDIETQTREEG